MDENLLVVLASALVAGLVGLAGPRVVAALPEPEPHPDDQVDDGPKVAYAEIAAVPRLGLWLALGSAAAAVLVASALVEADQRALVPVWTLFCGVGSWLAYVDLRTRYLPFALTAVLHLLALLLVGGAALVTQDLDLLVHGLVGNVVVFVVFWLFWRFARGGGLGYGDVRLSAVIGLVLGPLGVQAVLVGSYAGLVLGSLVAIVALARRRTGRRDHYALGPYLVVGALLGPAAVAWL